MLGPFNSSVINPALVPLALHFRITPTKASYQTTTVIVTVGISPLFWTPLANVYGRRPVYLISTFIGIIGTFGTGLAKTWAQLIVGRVFSGIGVGAAMALGAATVNYMFFQHGISDITRNKGTKMGIWTVFLTNGAHVGPIIGGYLAQNAGFRWCYYLPSILTAGVLIIMLFALPETLFSRSESTLAKHQERTYWQMLFNFRQNRLSDRAVRLRDFVRPFEMLKYPSVTLTLIYYFVTFCYESILPAVTAAILFHQKYHFRTGSIGLVLGLLLLIGSALGELLSGPFSDAVMYHYAKKHDGKSKSEARLPASFASVLLCPAGIIIYGVTVQHHTHWMFPILGMAIASFGLQLITTVAYTYCSDCYTQTGEIGTIYNFGRQVFAFPLGFYAIPFAEEIGVEWAWIVFASFVVVTFSGIIILMYCTRGKGGGKPSDNQVSTTIFDIIVEL